MAAVRNRPNWVFVSRFHTVFVANKMGYTSVMQDVVQDCRLRHQVLIFPMAIALIYGGFAEGIQKVIRTNFLAFVQSEDDKEWLGFKNLYTYITA